MGDGPTDGLTDGRTDGPTDRRTDGRTRPLIEMRSRILKLIQVEKEVKLACGRMKER